MKVSGELQSTALLIVVGIGLAWYVTNKAGGTVASVKEFASTKLNPASDENLVYNLPGAVMDIDYSFGSRLFDWFGGEENYSGDVNAGFEKPWYQVELPSNDLLKSLTDYDIRANLSPEPVIDQAVKGVESWYTSAKNWVQGIQE